MQIPTLFYGSQKEVRSRCRKVVNQLATGAKWQEIIEAEGIIDTANVSGLIVLEGPSSLLDAYGSHFHCYSLLDQIRQASNKGQIDFEVEEKAFESSLQTAWGLLGLIASKNTMWFWHPEKSYSLAQWRAMRYEPLLTTSLIYWDTLDAEGERYSNGSSTGQNLWSLPSSLKYVLANMGVSTGVLKAPLPPSGLTEIITSINNPPSL